MNQLKTMRTYNAALFSGIRLSYMNISAVRTIDIMRDGKTVAEPQPADDADVTANMKSTRDTTNCFW